MAKRNGFGTRQQRGVLALQIFAMSATLQLGVSFFSYGIRESPARSTSRQLAMSPPQSEAEDLPYFSKLDISEESKKAFANDFGFGQMTKVQAASIGPMLEGNDVIVRAKTGTGKTIGFLLPIVESICKQPAGKGSISALIISPTRELASQIAREAEVLVKYHRFAVACIYGGVGQISKDLGKLDDCDILVATPGRLQDHLDNTPGFTEKLSNLRFLALDEADQLLDMGFKDALLKILRSLPPAELRRTALFSATFPPTVDHIGKLALRPGRLYINTVARDEEETPDQIDQSVIMSDLNGMTALLWKVLEFERTSSSTSKILVFFNTAKNAAFFSQQFGAAGLDILEVHSRKTQKHRTKCSELFRKNKKAIMFSSDVSARGVDYPDVTAVIQVGAASSTDQYIHRIGRTGRAGKPGRCLLLLYDFESHFLQQLDGKGLPIKRLAPDSFPDAPPSSQLEMPVNFESASQAYRAWLGYYNSHLKQLRWTKDQLVQKATEYAASIGACRNGVPPPLEMKTVGKMGLTGVSGLNIVR
eukprot:TRINITY_DN105881_c0_g1_i1.p1 TRINITY_DN105881_c0_g1~~TRINITY_DN105881_c0_g1_i1.p1  ORF type:complete len:533 (-),score=91.17 TRINITY_DN105881_c0_g1_i1:50-1648(-)